MFFWFFGESLRGAAFETDAATSDGAECGSQTSYRGENVPIYFPTLATLHWLPILFHIHFKVLTVTYKALNGLGPRYLAEHLLPPSSTRDTHSSQAGQLRGLTLREVRKERTRNQAFSAVAPHLWNNLPLEIRLAPSLVSLEVN